MSFQPHGLSINMLPEPLHFQKGNVFPSQWHFYQNAAALSVHEKVLFHHRNLSTTSLYRMSEGLNVKECACNSRRPPNVGMFRPSPRAACTMGACPATPAGPSSGRRADVGSTSGDLGHCLTIPIYRWNTQTLYPCTYICIYTKMPVYHNATV